MSKATWITNLLVFLTIFVLVETAFLIYGFWNLKNELEVRTHEHELLIKKLENNISVLNAKLYEMQEYHNEALTTINDRISSLTKEYSDKFYYYEKKLGYLEEMFNETILSQVAMIQQLRDTLESFEAELEDRLSWIESNSNINNYPEYSSFKRELMSCLDGSKLHLACMWFIANHTYHIGYIPDELLGKEDVLSSLDKIFERKGGDCEDLSLLFAASLRYLISQRPYVDIVSWEDADGRRYFFYDNWYFPDARPVHLGNKRYVYVVCGLQNDINTGHCVVALCAKQYDYSDPDKFFEKCVLVDPQEYGRTTYLDELWLFITENDLCIVSENTTCFSHFKERLESVLSELNPSA